MQDVNFTPPPLTRGLITPEEWVASLDPQRYVGHRHHVVPQFILNRFANDRGQVCRRPRDDRPGRLVSVKDLAVRDFYTMIDQSGRLNASFEESWHLAERPAAEILRHHLDSPFAKPRPFSTEERAFLDGFVALQALRGPRLRRQYELIADFGTKLVNQHQLTPDELESIEFVPHQNEFLQLIANMLPKVGDILSERSAFLVELTQPLLFICDEPVVLDPPDDKTPMPDDPNIVVPEELIWIQGNAGVGLAAAEAIALPLSPRHALIYGPRGRDLSRATVYLDADESVRLARQMRDAILDTAVDWCAAHPDHPTFRSMKFPKQQQQLRVSDTSLASAHLRTTTRRRPRRLDKNAKPTATEAT